MRKPLDLQKDIGEQVAADQRVWEHDRSKTVGASEAFACHRRAFFKKRHPELAEEPEDTDDTEWGTAERGNLVEDKFAVPKLRAILGEENCKDMGDDQTTLMDSEAPLSCTPDGIVLDQPRDFLANYGVPDLGKDSNNVPVEIKTFDPRSGDLKTEARPRHAGQSIIQQGM